MFRIDLTLETYVQVKDSFPRYKAYAAWWTEQSTKGSTPHLK